MRNQNLETYVFLALLLGALVVTGILFAPYVDVVVVAATLAVVFSPLYEKILSFVRLRGIAAFLCVLIVAVVVIGPIIFFAYQVLQETNNLYATLSDNEAIIALQSSLSAKAQLVLPPAVVASFTPDVRLYIKAIIDWVSSNMGAIFSNIIQISFSMFLAFIAFYYLLKDGKTFKDSMIDHLPLPKKSTEKIFKKLQTTAGSIIKGTLVIAVIQGFLAGLGFWIFGVPQATFWGLVSVIASLFPTLGTALIVVPAVIYVAAFGNIFSAIGLLAWGTLIVGLVDNLLRPLLMEKDVEIHPFLILLSVFGGLAVFGPTGFIIGPLVLSFLFSLLDLYPDLIKKRAA